VGIHFIEEAVECEAIFLGGCAATALTLDGSRIKQNNKKQQHSSMK